MFNGSLNIVVGALVPIADSVPATVLIVLLVKAESSVLEVLVASIQVKISNPPIVTGKH